MKWKKINIKIIKKMKEKIVNEMMMNKMIMNKMKNKWNDE